MVPEGHSHVISFCIRIQKPLWDIDGAYQLRSGNNYYSGAAEQINSGRMLCDQLLSY